MRVIYHGNVNLINVTGAHFRKKGNYRSLRVNSNCISGMNDFLPFLKNWLFCFIYILMIHFTIQSIFLASELNNVLADINEACSVSL